MFHRSKQRMQNPKKRKFDLSLILKNASLPASGFLLLTHRGYGKRGPIAENTLNAFSASTDLGFRGHELDVRLTRDKVVVIFHGPDLSTTTNGKGLVESRLFSEIRDLNCSNYLNRKNSPVAGIPTLEEYLLQFGKKVFTNIEIKKEWYYPGFDLERKTIQLINKSGCANNVLISSFNLLSIYFIRKNFPDILAGALIDKTRIAPVWIPLAIKLLKPDSIHIHRVMATPRWIEYIKSRNCGVAIWGVNDRDLLANFANQGVDIMITDNMELIN